MITPSFGLTATERVLPKLALDFTTATLDPRVTFTRSGDTATYINSSGVITAINANLPRFDYNPTTLVCQGLLIEEARTNIVLNSLIDGTILNTQIVTTSAIAYTLSFYGTGSIVLTGTHSATVAGTSAYPSRKTYTFTPTAGALTLTVSGTVQYAQLEAGSFATSFIPTSVASVTRNADVATMTGTNFSSWFNASEGTFSFSAYAPNSGRLISVTDNSNNRTLDFYRTSNTTASIYANGTVNSNPFQTGLTSQITVTGAIKVSNYAYAANGKNVFTGSPSPIISATQLAIGNYASSGYMNGWAQKLEYWPQRLTNNEVLAFSKG